MRPKFKGFLVFVLYVGACVDQEPPPPDPHPLEVEEGEPCNWSGASCIDDSEMLRCIDGIWAAQSCDEYCADLGPDVASSGCDLALGTSFPQQLCVCEPPSEGCHPGQGRCDDQDTITWCADDWSWTLSSCTTLCATRSLLSLGCDSIGESAVCICTNIGTACDSDPPVCATGSSLSTCEDGLWVELDCVASCGGAGICDPGALGGAACACGG